MCSGLKLFLFLSSEITLESNVPILGLATLLGITGWGEATMKNDNIKITHRIIKINN